MKKNLYMGIDVGGTKIAAALVNERGRILVQGKNPTPLNAKPKAVLSVIRDLLDEIMMDADIGKKDISGIGIGIPGLVDAKGKEILRTPNINLGHFPLVPQLNKSFSVPIVLGNDVNVGLLGEKWLGAGRTVQDIVGIFPGTGVGGAIIQRGELVTGARGLAAEIGHMTMELDGPLCHCGNRGCLEALVSRWAMERDIRKAVARGEKTVVSDLANGKLQTIKSKILKKALARHDAVVTRIMRKAAVTLGKACVSLRHILNPEMIVLGGGVIEACGEFILPIVKKTVGNDPFFAKIDDCPVVAAQLGDDAVMLGAVALIKSRIRPAQKRSSSRKPR